MISSAGFFTDAYVANDKDSRFECTNRVISYDIFIINLVTPMLGYIYYKKNDDKVKEKLLLVTSERI